MCPSLNKLFISIGAASVEESFSQIKIIKTRLQKNRRDINSSYLMKIAIESSQYFSNDEHKKIAHI